MVLEILCSIITFEFAFNIILGSCMLTPYVKQHGSKYTHRFIRECHGTGKEPYELHPAYLSINQTQHFVEVKRFSKIYKTGSSEAVVHGHYAVVFDPLRTLSVLEPEKKGGCDLSLRQTVLETAKKGMCEVAINAGYFDTKNGNCLGNVISDGHVAHNSKGIQNAHFGLMKDKTIFTGYVPEERITGNSNFLQLVGGVVWILRNGSDFVNESKSFECEETEETGPMQKFTEVLSSRTAIGHDDKGRIVIVQVDGKTNHYGISLWDMQHLLKEMGLQNAINLDGGGSSTFVVNGTVVNYPSDECSDSKFICERKVSTIICIHPPLCNPPDCHGNGNCINGKCVCKKNWLPPFCDRLKCENNCSSRGICTDQGCQFLFGYYGDDCEKICPYGYYGHNCENLCSCNDTCLCHPVDGSCINEDTNLFTENGESCFSKYLAKHKILENAITDKWKPYLYGAVIIVGVMIIFIFGLLFIFYSCSCYCRSQRRFCKKHKRHRYMDLQTLTALSDSSESDSMPINSDKK